MPRISSPHWTRSQTRSRSPVWGSVPAGSVQLRGGLGTTQVSQWEWTAALSRMSAIAPNQAHLLRSRAGALITPGDLAPALTNARLRSAAQEARFRLLAPLRLAARPGCLMADTRRQAEMWPLKCDSTQPPGAIASIQSQRRPQRSRALSGGTATVGETEQAEADRLRAVGEGGGAERGADRHVEEEAEGRGGRAGARRRSPLPCSGVCRVASPRPLTAGLAAPYVSDQDYPAAAWRMRRTCTRASS
jgi:hypothetical protein